MVSEPLLWLVSPIFLHSSFFSRLVFFCLGGVLFVGFGYFCFSCLWFFGDNHHSEITKNHIFRCGSWWFRRLLLSGYRNLVVVGRSFSFFIWWFLWLCWHSLCPPVVVLVAVRGCRHCLWWLSGLMISLVAMVWSYMLGGSVISLVVAVFWFCFGLSVLLVFFWASCRLFWVFSVVVGLNAFHLGLNLYFLLLLSSRGLLSCCS